MQKTTCRLKVILLLIAVARSKREKEPTKKLLLPADLEQKVDVSQGQISLWTPIHDLSSFLLFNIKMLQTIHKTFFVLR